MPLSGYDVNPEGCARVLAQVENDPGRPAALTALQNAVADAQTACGPGGTGAVVQALGELWQNTLALQAEAAETRIGNAVAGVREAVSIIAEADASMADAARASLAEAQSGIFQAPELKGGN
ncbi:DUF6507 family protein [Arthrobacter sp. zg-Y179]|uniref:DUF6507 family protein n=1 Tax=Arthrobacter sp. zg-Y179 TaxID=2894188 RepID=UPI001E4F921E|nr:DUF6507 family protein [Arthrobacter sp. zg-Y179]MCC9173283.1 DUF6507 family protein [Arthrobacter sp. zg-Y179]